MTMTAPRQRVTAQRRAIIAVLEGTDQFISAQDLHDKLTEQGTRIGLATVYRTLQSLVDEGSLDTIIEEGQTLYRACETTDHHHHLVCRICGKTVEIIPPNTENWFTRVAAQAGFSDVEHTLELIGLCSKCAPKVAAVKQQRAETGHVHNAE
ncbi:ferric uptake regulation protein [Actinobaculum suis]|nr:ferric uptake regulation protein [Actinobaculum suis]